MGKSIGKNFFYSSVLTVANYLFPLIVFPYVSRVLGVDGIGSVNFIDSIVNYYLLFSSMGIAFVGIREVAASKSDVQSLSKAFSSLLTLNALFTFGVLLAYVPLFFISRLTEYHDFLFLGAFKIIFNFLLIEWFFKGMEDFEFVTIRSVIIKTVYVILVFLLVRSRDDILMYYLLSVGMIVANAVVNCLYSGRFVRFSLSSVSLSEYVKPFLVMGLYTVLTSMYTSFNVTYLGFVTDDVQVGYYSTATKIYGLILSFFTAFSGVMLPRMTATLREGGMEQFKSYFHKSIDLLLCFSFPCIILFSCTAPEVIRIISGQGYEGAVHPMIITMPLLFVIGYEQILVYQVLMPLDMDKVIFRNSLIGAVAGIVLNILLVTKYKCIGSACVWFVCELIVLVLSQRKVTKDLSLKFPARKFLRNFIAYVPLVGILLLLDNCAACDSVSSFLLSSAVVAVYFAVIQRFVLRNEILRPHFKW